MCAVTVTTMSPQHIPLSSQCPHAWGPPLGVVATQSDAEVLRCVLGRHRDLLPMVEGQWDLGERQGIRKSMPQG